MYVYFFSRLGHGKDIYHHLPLPFAAHLQSGGLPWGRNQEREKKNCSMFSRLLYTQYNEGYAPWLKPELDGRHVGIFHKVQDFHKMTI